MNIRSCFLILSIIIIAFISNSCKDNSGAKNESESNADYVLAQEPNLYYGFNLDSFNIQQGKIEEDWTLSHLLLPFGVNQYQINQIAEFAKDSLNFRYVSQGKHYMMLLSPEDNKPLYCIYDKNPYELVCFNFSDTLHASIIEKEITIEEKELTGTIKEGSSLYVTIQNQLESNAASSELVEAIAATYAWSIDFFKLYPEDKFKVIYGQKNVEGVPVGISEIKAIYFNHRSLDYYAMAYNYNKKDGYFDEEGKGMKRAFLKAPVKFSRISSSYTKKRFHPVQKRYKAHLGTDYAAPTGTPILATADGTVQAAGFTKYNGNYVKLYHNSTYQTGYLHMTKIGEGIKKGKAIKQGDVIGYVGSTGLATGPHVCYRFWKNGHQIDHRKEKFETSDPIKPEDLEKYKTDIASIKARLDKLKF